MQQLIKITELSYNDYLMIIKKEDSDNEQRRWKLASTNSDDSQNWDALSLKMSIFQQKIYSVEKSMEDFRVAA